MLPRRIPDSAYGVDEAGLEPTREAVHDVFQIGPVACGTDQQNRTGILRATGKADARE